MRKPISQRRLKNDGKAFEAYFKANNPEKTEKSSVQILLKNGVDVSEFGNETENAIIASMEEYAAQFKTKS
jgi:hypothetical protein